MAGQTIGSLLVRIGSDINPMIRGLRKAERELTRTAQKMQSMGERMTVGLTLPLAGIGAAALKSFGDFEKLEKGMAAVMGSSEAAKAELEKLKKVAEAPGLGFEQAIAGSIRLQAVGMSADEARRTLSEFGNAIATTGGSAEDLDQITRQLTQMISKNRILQEDFMVLQERMPMVTQAMDKAFGVTNIEQIREMGISARDFVSGLTNAMSSFDRVEGGMANAFENMQIAIKSALAQVGASLEQTFNITENMGNFAAWVQRMADAFTALPAPVQKTVVMVAALAAAIGPLLVVTAHLIKSYAVVNTLLQVKRLKMLALIKTAGGFKGAMLLVAGSLKRVAIATTIAMAKFIAIGAAIALVANYIYQNWEPIGIFFHNLWADIVNATKKALQFMLLIIDDFVSNVTLGQVDLKLRDAFNWDPMEKKATKAMGGIVESTATGAAQVSTWFRKMTGQADDAADAVADLEKQFDQLGGTMTDMSAGAGASGPTVMPGIVEAFEGIQSIKAGPLAGGADISGMAKPLSEILALIEKGKQKSNEWRNSFERMAEVIGEKAREFWETYGAAISSLGSSIQQAFQMREDRLNQYYDTELKRIEQSRMSEENKQKAIQRLEEETDKKRRKMARQAAIREKALAIVQATIGTALAVIDAIKKSNYVLAALNAAAGAAQIGVIASQSIPALAGGGLAYAPTMAMVGDNRGARVDPEVIAPLSKLRDYMGGAQNVIVTGRISGRDILLVQERAQQDRERVRGF